MVYKTAGSIADIPEAPGIYAFYISLIGPYSFGLRRGERVTETNAQHVRKALRQRLTRLRGVFRSSHLEGSLSDSVRSGPLQRVLVVVANECQSDLPEAAFEEMGIDELNGFLALGSKATFMLPPVYVGMTVDQTLRTRYLQHQASFASDKNLFGPRIRAHRFVWDDMVFSFADLSPHEASSVPLHFLEAQIQAICPPPLSVR